MKKTTYFFILIGCTALLLSGFGAEVLSRVPDKDIYKPGTLKPVESSLKVKVGDEAPDFDLPSVTGGKVTLSEFRGKKNVVLSFIPAAWTPVCSDQWPGYNIAKEFFDESDAILIGISVDNIPTQFAWTNQMGKLWFPVLSDFYPHGGYASKLGILRPNGVTERAIFIIDKKGIIRYIDVHDINERPRLKSIVNEMKKLDQ